MTLTSPPIRTSRRSRPTSRPAEAAPRRRTRGFEVIRWIETHCVFTKDEWRGQPFRLLPWQKRLLLELFELGADDLRRFWWAYISTAKKNGKTELVAAISLYLLIGEGTPAPLVVCAAASDDQADLVFGAAKTMCEESPTLREVTERFAETILVPSIPGAQLKRVAAVAGTNDGPNISAVICDELHEWKGPKGENVWNVLTNGVISRRSPFILQITTAGWDKETICGQQYELARRVLEARARGEELDPRYYAFIVEAPEEADHRDESIWPIANPSWDVTVRAETLRDQLTKKKEGTFRRYFLNQWTSAEESWLPSGAWEACRDPSIELDPDLPLFVGVDYAPRHDDTAVVAAQRQGERIVIRSRIWSNPFARNDRRHDEWHMPRATLAKHLRELFEAFPAPAAVQPDSEDLAPGPLFVVDRYQIQTLVEDLADEGLNVLDFPQWPRNMTQACGAFHQAIVERRLVHEGDPAMARHVANAIARDNDRGFTLEKPTGSPSKKIDGCDAGAMAVFHAQQSAPTVEGSAWEQPRSLLL